QEQKIDGDSRALPSQLPPANHPPQALLETFDTWEDERTVEEIVSEIYSSRSVSSNPSISRTICLTPTLAFIG
ncbi:MAG: hypothetical protein SVX43_17850, partial [Cyanobacteriota bacterium]|nr:hypothetical protein [Cyanobacteriota bacterium]